ncbi:lysozyme-like protein 6 isoform X4 [Tamandua tetradactyla]|uniref:lysozyme-like protein 6 isoform X4 n=1 Tax=Tamandua tetradactyla TaxID=48850 RepID=UPI00405469C6
MTKALFISLVSCLLVVNQAKVHVLRRCEVAKLMRQEDLDGYEGYYLSDWLCLAFVESGFNVSKINENADGSFDYGIFQINSHYWCNDYQSHTENLCHVDCQELLDSNLLAAINCAKKIVSAGGGMNNWIEWKLHCLGRPLSYWMTGCHL